jgi:hypothetical protein
VYRGASGIHKVDRVLCSGLKTKALPAYPPEFHPLSVRVEFESAGVLSIGGLLCPSKLDECRRGWTKVDESRRKSTDQSGWGLSGQITFEGSPCSMMEWAENILVCLSSLAVSGMTSDEV